MNHNYKHIICITSSQDTHEKFVFEKIEIVASLVNTGDYNVFIKG